jgi:RNA polymerase sigma-70 factor (ECF subfamily)
MARTQPDPNEANADQPGMQNRPAPVTPLSLLERARSRDPEAWCQLERLYRPLVLFWCRRGGAVGPDAEDLAQEVFAGAALGLERFHRDQPGDTFRGWLRGITRNQLLLHYRRNADQPRPVGGSDAWARLKEIADPLAGCEQDEQVEFSRLCGRVLEQVRGDFEQRTWQAFWRTVIDGRTPAALTEELGMSEWGIRQAKSRVLRRLKLEVGELME